ARNSRLRRVACGCTTTSIARSPIASRRRAVTAAAGSPPAKGMSAATSGFSQCGVPAAGNSAAAPSRIVESRAGAAGLQISVATRDMEQDRHMQGEGQPDIEPVEALLIAGPTASGKSALAVALAEALDGVVINTDSMQV